MHPSQCAGANRRTGQIMATLKVAISSERLENSSMASNGGLQTIDEADRTGKRLREVAFAEGDAELEAVDDVTPMGE